MHEKIIEVNFRWGGVGYIPVSNQFFPRIISIFEHEINQFYREKWLEVRLRC